MTNLGASSNIFIIEQPKLSPPVVPNRLHTRDWSEPGSSISSKSGTGASVTESAPIITPRNKNLGSLKGFNYGDDFLFERIWVQPQTLAIGFIVETVRKSIKIWNSDRFSPISVTDVSVDSSDGTQLSHSPLPDRLGIFGDTTYTLSILQDGPPLQDTTYTLTIEGQEFDISVSGIRVIPLFAEPNWETPVIIRYEFRTAIFKSKRLNEQRRPLSHESFFSTIFSSDLMGSDQRRMFNLVSYGKDKIFGVPVFNEKLTPTVLVQTGSQIIVSQEMSNYYNLNNRTSYVIIIDNSNGTSEIKEFSDITGNTITLAQEISEPFNKSTTSVYPCIFCILSSYNAEEVTDDIVEITLEFNEFK